jgi:hypothetical protein
LSRNIIWLGDFNYRIDLTAEDIKMHLKNENYQALIDADQVK